MPYIGNNHIVGDHINNFKVLDDISSYTATFDGSSTNVVSTSDETLRIAEHRFVQGQRVTYNNGGGSNIGGLSSGTAYYVSFDTTNTIKLATSLVNANNGTLINLTSAGGGTTHTLTAAFDSINTKFKLTHNGGESGRLNNATQLQVAINNVLQRPNSDPDNFTEGFAVEGGNKIVFQTAPTSNDIFWGSIIANSLPTFDIDAAAIDNFTGDGSATDFTLSRIPPNNASIIVTINGVFQHLSDPTTARAYSLEASVIKFTSAPASGDEIQVRHTGFRGALGDIVTGFYGRTGNVSLIASDDILTRNINSSGIITATSFSGSGANLTGIDATAVKDTSGNVKIQAQASGAVYTGIHTFTALKSTSADFSGNVSIAGTLTYEDVKNIDSVGLGTFREGIFLPDGKKALFGNAASNGDLEIYHSGSHSYIQNKTNFLFIHSNSLALRSLSQETFIDCSLNGSVDLYYDNAKKLETTSSGITVTGNATATTFIGALTGTASGNTTITNNADNRVVTGGSGNALNGESTLNYGSNVLSFTGTASVLSGTGNNFGGYLYRDGGSGYFYIDCLTGSSNSAGFKIRGYQNGTYTEHLQGFAGATKIGSGGSSDRLVIQSNGQISVGGATVRTINSHASRLQVQGNNYSDATVSIINNANSQNGAYLFLGKQRSGSAGGSTIVQSNDIIGQIRFNGADGTDLENPMAYIECRVDGTPGSNDMPGRLMFYTTADGSGSPTARMVIKNNGRVGINETNPSESLYVAGNIYATGNVTAYSDIRVKENVKEISNALEAVDKIRGVSYTRKDTKEDTLGVSAQEVETMFPELVVEDNHGMKSVNYNGLVGVLFSAVKELSTKLKEIENK